MKIVFVVFFKEWVVVLFLFGWLVYWYCGKLIEWLWMIFVVVLVCKNKVLIILMYMGGCNLGLFYFFVWVFIELCDMIVFNELLNKKYV